MNCIFCGNTTTTRRCLHDQSQVTGLSVDVSYFKPAANNTMVYAIKKEEMGLFMIDDPHLRLVTKDRDPNFKSQSRIIF